MTNTNEFDSIEQDLGTLFAVPVPALEFNRALTPRPGGRGWRGLRVGLGVAVTAAVIAGGVFVTSIGQGGGPATASAMEIISRSAAVSASLGTALNYHTLAVTKTVDAEVITETWVGGPDRFRTESRSKGSDGSESITGSSIVDDEMWVYQGSEGSLVVAHGPAIYRVEPALGGPPLEEQLAAWANTGCYSARLSGEDIVAGRSAHVISVTGTGATCPSSAKPLADATIWVDKQTEMPLRTVYVTTGAAASTSFETTIFDAGHVSDSDLAYKVPEGTRVVEFTTAAELKIAMSNVVIVPRGSKVTVEHD